MKYTIDKGRALERKLHRALLHYKVNPGSVRHFKVDCGCAGCTIIRQVFVMQQPALVTTPVLYEYAIR